MNTDAGIVYRVNQHNEIIFVNEEWRRFARLNDASDLADRVLGRSLWDFIGDSTTRSLYEQIIGRVRGGHQARFTLRCDGPTVRRLIEMTISPGHEGDLDFETRALSVVERAAVPLLARSAKRSQNLLRACAWCNQVDVSSDEWVEVEDAVERLRLFELSDMPQITHGICGPCLAGMIDKLDALASPAAG
jgi:hypothetical protein